MWKAGVVSGGAFECDCWEVEVDPSQLQSHEGDDGRWNGLGRIWRHTDT